MPEIGRPVNLQQQQYLQAGMKSTSNNSNKIDAKMLEQLGARSVEALKPSKDPRNMDQTDFLKLLSHQMQNQDPMNPADSSKYTTDLATFAQLEQLTNMNKKLEVNKNQAMMEQKLIAANFIGKNVVTAGNSVVTEKDGQSAQVFFNLEKPAKDVKVQILDAKGNLTAEIPMSDVGTGAQQVQWNGQATDGYPAPKGMYQVAVKAWDENSKSINSSTQTTGVVDSVFFDNGEVVLRVQGRKVFLRDVESFHKSNEALNEYAETNAKELAKAQQVNNSDIEKVKQYQQALQQLASQQ